MKAIVSFLIGMVLFSGVVAAESNCKTIKNTQKRLACYDAKDKVSEKTETASTSATSQTNTSNINAAKAALDELKKLQTRVEIGISYREYPQALAETKAAVDKFIDSNAAKALPEQTKDIQSALDNYLAAWNEWQYALLLCPSCDGFIFLKDYHTRIKERYPEVKTTTGLGGEYIALYDVLSAAWTRASNAILSAKNKLN